MGRANLLAWCLLAAGCGRIDFDARAGNRDGGTTSGDATIADGLGPPAVSCSGLAATCGPSETSPCCGSPVVPGGTYYRSYDVGTDSAYPDMTKPATVSDFRLDIYEVTVGRFRQFVNAGMGTQQNPPAPHAGERTLNGMANLGGWDPLWNPDLAADTSALGAAVSSCGQSQTWTNTPGANESLPMNCVTWYEAMAFCVWDGGFLPTETEWNYAAAGGSEQRAYPWSLPPSSLTVDCAHANGLIYTNYCANPVMGVANRVGSESPIGDGRWGQTDLAGNVAEWTLDWYAAAYSTPCDDCANLSNSTNRVLRGGGFGTSQLMLRGAARSSFAPTGRSIVIGWRCARAP